MLTSHRISAYLFLAPALLLFGFVILWPSAQTVLFSFWKFDQEITRADFEAAGLIDRGQSLLDVPEEHRKSVFVGTAHYERALEDPALGWSFFNNSVYLAATLLVEAAFGAVLAFFVARGTRMAGLFRTLFFTPMVLSLVVTGLLWKAVFALEGGVLPQALRALGLNSLTPPSGFLGDPATAMFCICVVSGWVYAGFYMVLFYAAIVRVPRDLVEAAQIDGAGEWRIITKIYLPLLWEVIVVSVLLCATGAFRAYDLFYVMARDGGPFSFTEPPHKTTEIVSILMMNRGFGGEFGYGCAIAAILTAVVLGVAMMFSLLARRRTKLEY